MHNAHTHTQIKHNWTKLSKLLEIETTVIWREKQEKYNEVLLCGLCR